MVRVGLVISFIWLHLGIASGQSQTCPGNLGWLAFGTNCYKFVGYPQLPKASASTVCRTDGAALVSVNTIAEHDFIQSWLENNDVRRTSWVTSGIALADGVRWEGDGAVTTTVDAWIIPEEYRLANSFVTYDYSNSDAKYGWSIGGKTKDFSYICEIPLDEVYRIVQEVRDFDYGVNVENAGLAPRGPMFVQEPQDIVLLGETTAIDLICLASGLPEPTYQWMHQDFDGNMQPLRLIDRYTLTTGKLTIADPTQNDAGIYQCTASNEYGTILSTQMELTFGAMGEFANIRPAAVYGDEYNGAQLECPEINGKPALSYQWYKNSFMTFVRPNAQIHTFISANKRLYFSELASSDAGTYFCMASLTTFGSTNDYSGGYSGSSGISMGLELIVNSGGGREYQPVIQNDFIYIYPQTPTRGGTIRLECFAYGTGPLEYTWSREGKPLPKNHLLDSNNRILYIYDAQLEDGGRYTCKVFSTKTNEDDERSTNLIIQAKPYFTYPLTHMHMDIGSPMTWHCEAFGQPSATYSWYKDGKLLRSSDGVSINVNSLNIDAVDKKRDSGMYQCAATNRYGTVYSTAQLRVLELAPSFEKTPMVKTMSSALNGHVTIICDPTAAPSPTYTWLKDGLDLGLTAGVYADEDHRKLLVNGNLVIQKVQINDQGRYTCQVENSLGTASDFTNLVTIDSTMISTAPNDDRVEVNLTATLLCRASHAQDIDLIYVWKFNDHVIDYFRESEYRLGEGAQEGSLYIIGAQFRNEGRYTCTATTGMDQFSASAYLTVLGPPDEAAGVYVQDTPIFQDNTLGPELNLGTTRWLYWVDGQDHGSTITHYFIEFRTNFDQDWRTHSNGYNIPRASTMNDQLPDKHFYMLTNLKAGAGIEFRVRARNSFGIGNPSLPTAITQIAGAKPTQLVKNVRGGGGSVGDLVVVWDPLPEEDHNGPGLQYRVSWRTYEAGSQSDASKWRPNILSHETACEYVLDYVTGLTYMCKFVELVGAENFYKRYEVTVQALNKHGNGPTTEPRVIMSAEELPLSAPDNVKGLVYNATALMITWTPIPNTRESVRGSLKGYKINYWRTNFDLEINALQNIIELPRGSYNLEQGLIIGLEAVRWYTFNVQAYNSAGNGPKSSDYEQQTLNRIPSEYPTEVHVYSVDGYGVRVNFRGISTQEREEPLLGYKVQYWQANENILSAQEANFGKMSTGVIRNLSSNALYQLRVFGYSRAGQGKRSSPSIFFTVGDGQILMNPETMETRSGVSTLTPSHVLVMLVAAVITTVSAIWCS